LTRQLEATQARLATLEAELAGAVRARDDTLSTVAHDLKNPMSAILLGIQRLERLADGASQPQARALAAKLDRTVRSMDRLVEGLVDLARLDAGRLRLDRRSEPVAPLLARALEPLAAVAAEKQQRLLVELESGLPDLSCDPERIALVVANLAGNALKFSPAGGVVRVAAQRQDHELVCSVSDEGPGIAADVLEHLLDRHWRPPDGARRGHGLGLFVAKAYVEAHGGRVWARSEVGRGSTFSFALPVG
jgi:signal transduction histidine kinase